MLRKYFFPRKKNPRKVNEKARQALSCAKIQPDLFQALGSHIFCQHLISYVTFFLYIYLFLLF